MNKKMIWYAAYGSNMLFDRFQYYIVGGEYPGNGRFYPGCSDNTLPKKSLPVIIPHALYFGNQSGSWGGGGVAFLDGTVPGFTLGRMYLITEEQFHEIQRQECNSPDWYGKTVVLGEYEDVPVKTFTSEYRHEYNAPSNLYLQIIKNGITEMLASIGKDIIQL